MSSERTRVRRNPGRGVYDWDVISDILDSGFLCHVGFPVDGQPFVIPMAYAREGKRLYLHGSSASRTMRALRDGVDVCVTVTIVDGLVLARSAMHHSMNYRSVVAFGTATEVTDPEEKRRALRVLTDYLVPGRSADVRGANARELKATMVLSIPLDDCSAKIRTGPPKDDESDLGIDAWAGIVPVGVSTGQPIDSPDLRDGIDVPRYVHEYVSNQGPSQLRRRQGGTG